MLYQYRCACCEKVVESTDKECPHCGSQHIRSPYGWWIFCLVGCLAVVMVVKTLHFYVQAQDDTPNQHMILNMFNHDKTTKSNN